MSYNNDDNDSDDDDEDDEKDEEDEEEQDKEEEDSWSLSIIDCKEENTKRFVYKFILISES